MGFERFGTVSFTTETKAADFINYLEKGQVSATRCKKCGRVYFPPRVQCADDLTTEVEWTSLSESGTLLTFTQVNYGPSGFENDTPYTLAVVEFDEGIRVFGRLDKTIPSGDIKVGMKLRAERLNLAEGKISYQFVKA
ncbi:MAG: Zn-ribbon domain-containing OB-fold protein [Dehalococcoidia bacterium]|nr:Zn-ribbon domain-containing OB-fold protein [Dehalococcoidia bacterium]